MIFISMGPPVRVAYHGAARSRETASFSESGSSSSCAQVSDLIRGHFRKMSNRSKSVHHHGPRNCHFKTQYQSAGRDMGHPVPLAYGLIEAGGAIVSAGMYSSDQQ